jgi:hypothetical protein
MPDATWSEAAELSARVPPYGRRTIGDLIASLMHGLGVSGFGNPLGLEPCPRVCLLVVDGLGWELLRDHAGLAPFLTHAIAESAPISAGVPSTTTASMGSFGTALPPGEHGMLGYTFALPGDARPLNTITWRWAGLPPGPDLRDTIVPEQLQPRQTVFQRAAAEGVAVTRFGPSAFSDSGLTRAAQRGGTFRSAIGLGDLVQQGLAALHSGERSFVWLYHSDLDAIGHVYGVSSEGWRVQLGVVDTLVHALAARLPADARLVVTADHGMVDVPPPAMVDLDQHPELAGGVRLLAGEPRARYVYAGDGQADRVLSTWQSVLGDRMWVLSRAQAIEAGLFGPTVVDRMRARIGDVVALARVPMGVVQRSVDPGIARLIGQHGSVTSAEQLVPAAIITAQAGGW